MVESFLEYDKSCGETHTTVDGRVKNERFEVLAKNRSFEGNAEMTAQELAK